MYESILFNTLEKKSRYNYHFTWELVEKYIIYFEYIPIDTQTAGTFIELLDTQRYIYFRSIEGVA